MYLPHLDATDIVQPIDAGYGRLIKQKMRAIQEEWLEDEDNMNLWIGNTDEKLNVAKRRILITHWAGAAFEMLQGEDYKPFLRNCFERTGCLLTADGSEDHLVKPEGLVGYRPLPPLKNSGPQEAPDIDIIGAEPPEDIIEPWESDVEIDIDEVEDLESADEDDPKDRVFDKDLVGKKVRGMYEGSGWHTGTIQYYNSSLEKYLLLFDDKSTDLIRKEDFGTELYVLEDQQRRSRRSERKDYNALANGM